MAKKKAFLAGAGPWSFETLAQVPEHTDFLIEEVGGYIVPVTWEQVSTLDLLLRELSQLGLRFSKGMDL